MSHDDYNVHAHQHFRCTFVLAFAFYHNFQKTVQVFQPKKTHVAHNLNTMLLSIAPSSIDSYMTFSHSALHSISVSLACTYRLHSPYESTCYIKGQLKKKQVTHFVNVTVEEKILNQFSCFIHQNNPNYIHNLATISLITILIRNETNWVIFFH